MNFKIFCYGALSAVTLTLSGCYVATPYGYVPYGTPIYAYPPGRYQAYPAQYAQPQVANPPPAPVVQRPAPASRVVDSIYFDVNSAIIKPEYQSVIQTQADYLRAHPDVRVTLQGNADERGASGRNLSLGTRRADAVRRALEGYGVSASQISTVSFGDLSPANPAKDESAYAKNRRVDFSYRP
ncbi:MAG: OmpA family protein [Burkholderiaceae bacterium]|nr:OmpA family protein [Burkholderiaceae bacterium]